MLFNFACFLLSPDFFVKIFYFNILPADIFCSEMFKSLQTRFYQESK